MLEEVSKLFPAIIVHVAMCMHIAKRIVYVTHVVCAVLAVSRCDPPHPQVFDWKEGSAEDCIIPSALRLHQLDFMW